MLIILWFIVWPIICLTIGVLIMNRIVKNNRERVGWAETHNHPTFGLVMKKGQAYVTLQLGERQFFFEYPEELEKLLNDGEKQNQRAKTMAAVLDDSLMKSELEKELESL